MAEGKGYIDEHGTATAWRPPGWPLLLALSYIILGPSQVWARCIGLFISVGTIILTYFLGTTIIGRTTARIAAILQIPFLGQFGGIASLLSEPLQTFLLVLFLFLIKEYYNKWMVSSVVAGGILGLLVLTRPSHVLLVIAAFVFFVTEKSTTEGVKRIFLLSIVALLVCLPWAIRNYCSFGKPMLVSNNSESNFFIGNNPLSNGSYRAITADEMQELKSQGYSGNGYEIGIRFFLHQPVSAVINLFRKVFHFIGRDDGAVFASIQDRTKVPRFIIYGLASYADGYWYLLLATALIGMVGISLKREDVFLLLCTAGTILITVLVYFGEGRFHTPIAPLVTLFSASGMVKLSRRGGYGVRDKDEKQTVSK
ncbi:MAG: glycosyltransferase family 39 protein [Bacteroidota bacterium]|jgi:4-amino-4-deoxy-L-arabinose transferase-like glycosyltransferase